MPLEVERKYLHVDFAVLRRTLYDLGARTPGAHFESNWVFDTPDIQLFESRRLLRLRSQEWPDAVRHVLTLKLPASQSGHFKVREERELEVADGAAMRAVLEGLGYAVGARYEKIREPWLLEDVEVELDVLPFAEVVELEGEAAHIERAATRLGLDKAEISTKSYHQLHQDWRRLHNLPPDFSFVFDAERRSDWRRRLALLAKSRTAATGPTYPKPEAFSGDYSMPLYNQGEADGESRTIVVKKLKEPDRYRVLLHNDDYTSMDFVIILCGVFHKPLKKPRPSCWRAPAGRGAVRHLYPRSG